MIPRRFQSTRSPWHVFSQKTKWWSAIRELVNQIRLSCLNPRIRKKNIKKNKCPQASTWQSVCSTAGMWYVIWSHLSSSWQICKLLPLKRILHGTFANRYFQDIGMSTQGTQRRERRDHGDQNGAHCGFCQLVPNWIQGWIIGSFFYKFCPSPIVALCIWFSFFCGLRPTFTFHGGFQVSTFTFSGGNQLSTSDSCAGRRLCQSAQVTPWIQRLFRNCF